MGCEKNNIVAWNFAHIGGPIPGRHFFPLEQSGRRFIEGIMDVKKYIGRKYQRSGYNCYSLVRDIQRDLGRDILPDIDAIRLNSLHGCATICSELQNTAGYKRVSEPRDGSIAIIKLLPFATHTGVYIGNGQIIHNDETRGQVVIDDITSLKIEGWYDIA